MGHRIGKVWDFTKKQWRYDVEVTCQECGQYYQLSILTKQK